MNIKEFASKLKSIKLIAHRLGYQMTNYPENSMEVLNEIFKNTELLDACSGFEFDICFTKDHIPVVIHDKYIDDISDGRGLVKSHTMKELEKFNFNFRKSLNKRNSYYFKIVKLERILDFFIQNKKTLKKKIIKIETKDTVYLKCQNMRILADILNNYSEIGNNIVHLSYYPQNLIALKRIQYKKNYAITKSDLLCDYKIMVNISRFIGTIDSISVRIKTSNFPGTNHNNSKRVNRKLVQDSFFMKFSNALSEKTLSYAIKKYGSIGIYVLNGKDEILEFCKRISYKFFLQNYTKINFTTNNPVYIKTLELNDKDTSK